MKYIALSLALLTIGTFSHVARPRDLSIQDALSTVSRDLTGLDKSVQAFSGTHESITAAISTLIKTIKEGKTGVDGSKDLTLVEALGLQQPLHELKAQFEAAANDVKGKKAVIQKSKLCGTIRPQAGEISKAIDPFSKAIASKNPAAAQPVVQQSLDGLKTAVSSLVGEFSENNCKDAMA
ncbi:hypothetical protein PT974_05386 [Cladobotryum mycophilum]|uniref:Cell wall protein n=1 Tax=Cladobotryum mycophilum TaxID=491253 RepID=A0ABR0SIL3_9HYPO